MMTHLTSASLTAGVSPISLRTVSNQTKRFVAVTESLTSIPTVIETEIQSISSTSRNSILPVQTLRPVAVDPDYNRLDNIALQTEKAAQVFEPDTARNSACAVVGVSDDIENQIRAKEIQTTLVSASRDVKGFIRTHEELKDALMALRVTGGHNWRRNSSKNFLQL